MLQKLKHVCEFLWLESCTKISGDPVRKSGTVKAQVLSPEVYVQVDHTPAFYAFPKNCGVCDFDVAKSLIEFNLKKRLDLPGCRCKREWEKELQKQFPPLQERLPHLYEKLIQHAASRREGQQ